jgi:pyridoxal phosphate enzyme (YggS family)
MDMDEVTKRICQNLAQVHEKIERAARSSGRAAEKIQLVVVSKAQPVEAVRAAVAAGACLFGENYPELAQEKITALAGEAVEWHMIGHLQGRKARIVAEEFNYLHSLDRLELAERLERLLAPLGKQLPVLLEFNLAGEASKSGWPAGEEADWEALLPNVEAICSFPHLQVRGLMTMPPLFADPQQARPYFVRLARLRDFLAARVPSVGFEELSMGTSADYEVAVQEGATFVRVGTAILGPRGPKQG